MIVSLPWMELSSAQQRDILHQMTDSFQKPWHDGIPLRFFRPSCRVDLYYTDSKDNNSNNKDSQWIAAAISWKYSNFRYLDKFFVRPSLHQKGIGREWLAEWIHPIIIKNERWIWRTSLPLATQFYGKHPAVITHGQTGDYVYQGIRPLRWETEDIQPLLDLLSCFRALVVPLQVVPLQPLTTT